MKFLLSLLLLSSMVSAEQFNHSVHHQEVHPSSLKEAGNDAFGTIQEVIHLLETDPTTNWKKVNIEALRLHLIDMYAMTLHVKVLYEKPLLAGLETVIEPTSLQAKEALERVLNVHPKMLREETGWIMHVIPQEKRYILRITTHNEQEIDKIRALGYIGLMAYGSHHQRHHLMMALGKNPH